MEILRYSPRALWRLDDSSPFQDYSGYSAAASGGPTPERKGVPLVSDASYSQYIDNSNKAQFESTVYKPGYESKDFSLAATIRSIQKTEGYEPQPYRENLAVVPVPQTVDPESSTWRLSPNYYASQTTRTIESTGGPFGNKFLRKTINATTNSSNGVFVIGRNPDIHPQNAIPVDPGAKYTVSVYVRSSIAHNCNLYLRYFDENGNSTGLAAGAAVEVPPNVWTRVYMVLNVPANARSVAIRTQVTQTEVGATFDISCLLVERGEVLGSYFDGDMPGCEWSGTPNASFSRTRKDVSLINKVPNGLPYSTSGYVATTTHPVTITMENESGQNFIRYFCPSGQPSASYKVARFAVGAFSDCMPGDTLTLSFDARTGGDWIGYNTPQIRISNGSAGNDSGAYFSGVSLTDTWQRFTRTITVGKRPGNDAGLYFGLRTSATTQDSFFDIKNVIVVKNNTSATSYFDGNSVGAYWSGAAGNSWSYMLPSNGEQQILGRDGYMDGLTVDGTKVSFSTAYQNTGYAKCTYDVGTEQKLDIVGVHTEKKNSLYVNGEMVAEVDITTAQQADAYVSTTDTLSSGSSLSSRAMYANNFALFGHALNSEDIGSIYRANNRRPEGSVAKSFGGEEIFLGSAVRPAFLDVTWATDEDWNSASHMGTVVDNEQLTCTMSNGLTAGGVWTDSVDLYSGETPIAINSVNMWWSGANELVEASVDGTTWVTVKKGENISVIPTGFDPTDKALYIRVTFPEGKKEAYIDSMRVTGYTSNTATSGGRTLTYENPIVALPEQTPALLRDDWGVRIGQGGRISIGGLDPSTFPVTNLLTNPSAETGVAGVSVNRVTVTSSGDWAVNGSKSFKLTRTSDTPTDAFIDIISQVSTSGSNGGKLKPDTQYTIMGTYKLNTLMTGATVLPDSSSGLSQRLSIFVHLNGSNRVTVLGTNTVGTKTLKATFTTPSTLSGYNSIRFYGGGAPGDIIEWDSLLLVEGNYTGDYFDGSSEDSQYVFSWNGTPHGSTSTKTSNLYRPIRTIEVWMKPDNDVSGVTLDTPGETMYQNGVVATGDLKAGEWVIYHRVLPEPYSGGINISVPGQVGKVVLYENPLTATQVSEIVSNYTGYTKVRYDDTGALGLQEPSTSVSIYAYDWESLNL